MSVECLLFDEAEQIYYRILYGVDSKVVLCGSNPENMALVEGAQISYYRDGGSLQAYTPDGFVINVPQRRFDGLDTQPKIARYETRAQQRQHDLDMMSEKDREFFIDFLNQVDDDMPAHYNVGARFDAPDTRALTTLLHIDGGVKFV